MPYKLVLYMFLFLAYFRAQWLQRLSDFPWVIVRIDCPLCPRRKGQYRLARLAEKYGADVQLCDLLDRIALDCPRRKTLPWEPYLPRSV